MMLLRADWKSPDAAEAVTIRCASALHFIAVLISRAAALGSLQGPIFQGLMARHAAVLQQKRDAEEAARAAAEAAALEDGAPADAEALPSADADVARGALRSRDGGGGGGGIGDAPLPAALQSLSLEEVDAMSHAGAELRALVRIKVEDDQDLKTARQAIAECAAFLRLLREEAPKRGMTEAALLHKLELGEG